MCVQLYRWSIELEENISSTIRSLLGLTLLFIEKTTIDRLHLWVISAIEELFCPQLLVNDCLFRDMGVGVALSPNFLSKLVVSQSID